MSSKQNDKQPQHWLSETHQPWEQCPIHCCHNRDILVPLLSEVGSHLHWVFCLASCSLHWTPSRWGKISTHPAPPHISWDAEPHRMSCPSSSPTTRRAETAQECSSVSTNSTPEPGWVGDCPQACQPHDPQVWQSWAAGRWTPTVPVAFANSWDSCGIQQRATAPCSCPLMSAEHGISLCSTRLLGSYFQRYYLKSVEQGAL